MVTIPFKKGDRVRMSAHAIQQKLQGRGSTTGVVSLDQMAGIQFVRVLRDGRKRDELWATVFWELDRTAGEHSAPKKTIKTFRNRRTCDFEDFVRVTQGIDVRENPDESFSIVLLEPRIDWSGSFRATVADAELLALELKDAIEVFKEWDQDTGKLAEEVLKEKK